MDISGGIQASLAGRYAIALFELAREREQLESVQASLGTLRKDLEENEMLLKLATDPRLSRAEALKTIGRLAGPLGLDPLTQDFLGVVARNRRLSQLGGIIRAFTLLAARHRGEITAEVTSARPLDAGQVDAIRDNLSARFGSGIALDIAVDPAILGGLVVKVGSQRIDGSIRTKLNTLALAMKG